MRFLAGNLRIKSKLWLAFILVATPLVLLCWADFLALRMGQSETESLLQDRLVPMQQLKSVADAYGVQISLIAERVIHGQLGPEESVRRLQAVRSQARAQWAAYKATFMVPAENLIIPQVDAEMIGLEPGLDQLQNILTKGDPLAAERFHDEEFLPKASPLLDLLNQLTLIQQDVAESLAQRVSKRFHRAQILSLILLPGTLLAALALGRWMTRDFSESARRIVGQMQRAADGDLEQSVAVEGLDELADMARALNRMIVRLRENLQALKQREQELRESEHRAQSANRAKSAFLSNMSHELRTPLNSILGYTQLMARTPGRSREEGEQLDRVHRAGEHLLSLINDVLSIAKIEAESLRLKTVIFSSEAFFQALHELFLLRARNKGLAFDFHVQERFPDYVRGDEGKLRQVLANLLGNAVKFAEAGSVSLEASHAQGIATFKVRDTGPGISQEDRASLFQPFFRSETQPQAHEGTGLGLHISRSLITLMGGDIQVESQPGCGACFSVVVPLEQAEGTTKIASEGRVLSLVPGQRSYCMLVVDDKLESREVLARLLASAGFHVETATDGKQGLQKWEGRRWDLVWMDLRMPELDGFEAVKKIRALEEERNLTRTPVVAISASVLDVDPQTARDSGFDDFQGKPFREREIFESVAHLTGARFLYQDAASVQAPELLSSLPNQKEEWRTRCRNAALAGDTEEALKLIDEISEPALASALRQMVKTYRLDELAKALNT
jgi:signal transduction histidine kinase/CheY-like chemotaxis protein